MCPGEATCVAASHWLKLYYKIHSPIIIPILLHANPNLFQELNFYGAKLYEALVWIGSFDKCFFFVALINVTSTNYL